MSNSREHTDQDRPEERVLLDAESTAAFVERRRFQDLFEARKHVVERLRQRPAVIQDGQYSDTELDEDLQAAVRSYVLETETLYRNTAVGKRLWNDRVLGPAQLSRALPPHIDYSSIRQMDTSRLSDDVKITGDALHLHGVKAFAELSSVSVDVQVAESVASRNPNAVKPREMRISLIPPSDLSEAAFRVTDELLSELQVLGKLGAEDYEADEPGL